MTAIAHGARLDHAFVAADAGVFGAGGVIVALQRKIIQIPHLNAVLAYAGLDIGAEPVLRHARRFSEISAFLRSLPMFAHEVREELQDDEALLEDSPKLVILYVAFYDRERRIPGSIQIWPEGGRLSAPFQARAVTTGGQPSAALQGRQRMESRQDIVDFMEAARAVPASSGNPGCAGWVDLARVSAKGISIRRVHRWNDRIGRLPGARPADA